MVLKMTDDVFEKLQERIDHMENIYGAELNNTRFDTAEENDLERRLCPKKYRWIKK